MMTCTTTKIDRDFITAGNAIVTIGNDKGVHFTYKVRHKEANGQYPECYFVNLLTGSDNENDYSYLGMLDLNTNAPHIVRLTAKSCAGEDALSVKVVRWAFRLLFAGKELPEGYTINHEGFCGRCGRTLTTPESVERGIGPECIRIMSGAA